MSTGFRGKFKNIGYAGLGLVFLVLLGFFFTGANNTMTDNRKPLSGEWENLFSDVQTLNQRSDQSPIVLKDAKIHKYDLSSMKMAGSRFENTGWLGVKAHNSRLENIKFNSSRFEDVDFSGSVLMNTIFEECDFVDVLFDDTTLINVKFIGCRFSTVKFRELQKSVIEFKKCELQDMTDFDGSEIQLTFSSSSLLETDLTNLKIRSSLNFQSSRLENVNCDRSNLTSFTATDSQLKKTKLQDCNIGKVVLTNSTVDVYFSRAVIDTVRVSETQNELLGFLGSNVNDCSIGFCKEGGLIGLTGMKFKTLKINNCNDIDLKAPEIVGKEFTISNCKLKEAKFYDMAVEYFILDNVEFNGETDFEGAQAKKSEVRNIKKGSGATVTAKGSNIKFY